MSSLSINAANACVQLGTSPHLEPKILASRYQIGFGQPGPFESVRSSKQEIATETVVLRTPRTGSRALAEETRSAWVAYASTKGYEIITGRETTWIGCLAPSTHLQDTTKSGRREQQLRSGP
jgi:hypothetical protein